MSTYTLNNRPIEVLEVDGEVSEGAYAVDAIWTDVEESSHLTDKELDQLNDKYAQELYDDWYQNQVSAAEDRYDHWRENNE